MSSVAQSPIPTGAIPAAQSAAPNALSKLNEDYDNFLLLLTQQLKNQDPLSPLDANEFTQQLVAFSSVEQMIQSNKRLDQLIALQSATNAYGAVSFLGSTVAVDDNRISLQDGKASYDYNIEHGAGKAMVTIYNKQGQPVLVQQVDKSVGNHHVDWDGQDLFGHQLPDGEYRVSVIYEDQGGNPYQAPITAYGTIDSAELVNGDIRLFIGDVGYPAGLIKRITRPSATEAA
jgi:flagellar basal-body rod modification protein FlgD